MRVRVGGNERRKKRPNCPGTIRDCLTYRSECVRRKLRDAVMKQEGKKAQGVNGTDRYVTASCSESMAVEDERREE